MRIEAAIRALHAMPAGKGWVRLESVGKARSQLELRFSIHEEKRGRKKTGALHIVCRGVREAHITDFDGGGLALYPTTHPAARQYTAPQTDLRWIPTKDRAATLGTLYEAHSRAVSDWIPFDRYVSLKTISNTKCVCRGPIFLVRAYAKALRATAEDLQLTVRSAGQSKRVNPRVLHFGASFVVAAQFLVGSEIERLNERA